MKGMVLAKREALLRLAKDGSSTFSLIPPSKSLL